MPRTEMWLGITLDEIQRMKVSQLPRVDYIYPLIDQRMSRGDCYKFLKKTISQFLQSHHVLFALIIQIKIGKK